MLDRETVDILRFSVVSFAGTRRFELIRKLGEGGQGLVYEAQDEGRGMRVALKTLRSLDADSLYRFKQEFRVLSDISHPNIIGLYDLVHEDGHWFFTMELVDGKDVIAYARASRRRLHPNPEADNIPTRTQLAEVDSDRPLHASAASLAVSLRPELDQLVDEGRLRSVLLQLADALHALHSAGLVHRDLKPSNVRVTHAGRVVLVDFGIAAESSVLGDFDSEGVSGTPLFMAPEQAAGQTPSAAADWYSFGVILFVALTGRLPLTGPLHSVMSAKQWLDAPTPQQLTAGIPTDLSELCSALLARDPKQRPQGREVLERLGGQVKEERYPDASRQSLLFVGRDRELERLREAFLFSRQGHPTSVFVRGASGMGKSTLIKRFLDELSDVCNPPPLVLRGRCHERERVPYKAFDAVVDRLSMYLAQRDAGEVEALLPEGAELLPRIFPVLRRVPALATHRDEIAIDPQQVRAQAFVAFGALLARLASEQPVCIFVDDVQWADRDSQQLLTELLRDPGGPALLFLATVRHEGEHALGTTLAASAPRHRSIEIDLRPLEAAEQHTLVKRLAGIGAADAVPDFWAQSGGSPLFLTELVRFRRDLARDDRLEVTDSLETMIYRRVERLPAPARNLLEMTAVSGEPTALDLLGTAAELSGEERERALRTLRVASLVRVVDHDEEPRLTCYHDRIREAIGARLAPERERALHRGLAQSLERQDARRHAAKLARHLLAAGERVAATAHLLRAAQDATDKLAFEQAAELLLVALSEGQVAPQARPALLEQRARALALAGRGFEAAQVFRQAAAGAVPELAADLIHCAADSLLRSGHIQLGLDALQDALNRFGIRWSSSPTTSVLRVLFERTRLAFSGLEFQPRAAHEVPARELARLRTLHSITGALGMIDPLRGNELHSQYLRAALELGEETTAWRALAIEASFRSTRGGKHVVAAEHMTDQAMAAAQRLGDPFTLGAALFVRGMLDQASGRFRSMADNFDAAERAFVRCPGSGWEIICCHFFGITARLEMGEYAAVASATEGWLADAERRNDLFARALFLTHPNNWQLLCRDRPGEAQRSQDRALVGWPTDAFFLPHYFQRISWLYICMYEGRWEAGLSIWRDTLRHLKRSMIYWVPLARAQYHLLLLPLLHADNDVAGVERSCGVLSSLQVGYFDAHVLLYRAALAARGPRGRERAQELLRTAEQLFERLDIVPSAMAARFEAGRLLGGVAGARMQEQAAQWLTGTGVCDPERIFSLLAPPMRMS